MNLVSLQTHKQHLIKLINLEIVRNSHVYGKKPLEKLIKQ